MQCMYYEIPIKRRLPENMSNRTKRRRRKLKRWIPYAELLGLLTLVAVIIWAALLRTSVEAAETPVKITVTAYAAESPDTEDVPAKTVEYGKPWTEEEAVTLAQAMWGEARGCGDTHMAAVGWCALNRVDAPQWSNDLVAVLTQQYQFCGYDPEHPVDQHILEIAEDVLMRWYAEKETGLQDPGRVLPENYYFFTGDGELNYFRTDFEDTGAYWDWSLSSPYEN